MHASVQHKPPTLHSMFIKVATAVYVSQHYEKQKNIFSVICDGASGFEAVLLHALAFLDFVQKSPPFLSSSASFEWFCFLKICFGGKYVQKNDKLYSICQNNQTRSINSNQAWLVSLLECLCVCMRVVNSESHNTFRKESQFATVIMSNNSKAMRVT